MTPWSKLRAMWIAKGEFGEMSDCVQSTEMDGVIAYKARPVLELLPVSAVPVPPPPTAVVVPSAPAASVVSMMPAVPSVTPSASVHVSGVNQEPGPTTDSQGREKARQEMARTSKLDVSNWGEEGWVLGALRSFGEPLAMAIDREGHIIYVADIGNNRVQRFNLAGRAERQWGPRADVANDWFTSGRAWYPSGAKPGVSVGAFVNPLDVTVLPGKKGNSFAVLDANGRVQIFDHEVLSPIDRCARSMAAPAE